MSRLISVENDTENRELRLSWQDQTVQRFRHADLRRACPCAFCRADRLRGRHWREEPDIHIVAARPMGYGLQLVFSDGHDRGIFPWVFFTELDLGADAAPAWPQPSAG